MEKMSSGDMWRDCLEVRTDGRGFQKGLVFHATFVSLRPCENNWSPQIPILTVFDCRTVPWHEKNLSPYWTWKPQNTNCKIYMHPNLQSSSIYSSQDVHAMQVSISRGMKMWNVYTMEYYPVLKRKESSHLWQHGWTWKMQSETSQKKDKY